MSDIVTRLRDGCPGCNRMECKAADEIERLRAEIARLRDALKIYVHVHETGNKVPPAVFRHKVLMVVAADVKEVGRE